MVLIIFGFLLPLPPFLYLSLEWLLFSSLFLPVCTQRQRMLPINHALVVLDPITSQLRHSPFMCFLALNFDLNHKNNFFLDKIRSTFSSKVP